MQKNGLINESGGATFICLMYNYMLHQKILYLCDASNFK